MQVHRVVLSRYVRASIICNDVPVSEDTATVERIEEIAVNLICNGHDEVARDDMESACMVGA